MLRAMVARALIVDDEPGLREMLRILLRRAGYDVTAAARVDDALASLGGTAPSFDLVVTDLALPDGSGMDVLRAARERDDSTQVVVITAYGGTEKAVEAMRLGAYDFVQKPFRNDELLALLEKALEKRGLVGENRALRAQVEESQGRSPLVGRSPAMAKIMDLVRRVAASRTSVLITGESGTGKAVVARAIHDSSDRASGPFVTVNCGALPEALIESELFGHVKGAFTGASTANEGLFRAAHEGTIFLDEVGDLPLAVQVKLLVFLQERRVRAVGSQKEHEVDVRVVAATNRDMEADVAAGTFRQDLFYRLNVIRMHLPPLRERPEDLLALSEHFLAKHMALSGKRLHFSPEAMRWMVAQPYPGNVRELENVVERAVTLAVGDTVTMDDLPERAGGERQSSPSLSAIILGEGFDIDTWLGSAERTLLERALEETGGNQTAAAKLLGTTFRSLRYRLRKYGLGPADDADEGGGSPE